MNAFWVGMRGPGAAIAFTVPKPASYSGNWASPVSRALTVIVNRPGDDASFTIEPGEFTWSGVTADEAVASYEPDGTEFETPGTSVVRAKLVLDGDTYDFNEFTMPINRSNLVP